MVTPSQAHATVPSVMPAAWAASEPHRPSRTSRAPSTLAVEKVE